MVRWCAACRPADGPGRAGGAWADLQPTHGDQHTAGGVHGTGGGNNGGEWGGGAVTASEALKRFEIS